MPAKGLLRLVRNAELDMSDAARAARAHELGYNVNAWHWSPNQFDQFADSGDIGYHFGTREQSAYRRAIKTRNGATLNPEPAPYLLRLHNPYRMDDLLGWQPHGMFAFLLNDSNLSERALNRLKMAHRRFVNGSPDDPQNVQRAYDEIAGVLQDEGYDGIVYQNKIEGNGDSYIVFRNSRDPSQIRRPSAAFDPSRQDSPLLDASWTGK